MPFGVNGLMVKYKKIGTVTHLGEAKVSAGRPHLNAQSYHLMQG